MLYIHLYLYIIIQVEQEFGLILGKAHAKKDFIAEWFTKYVPAIISYGQKCGKRAMSTIIDDLNEHGK